jgi:hypothetical protein
MIALRDGVLHPIIHLSALSVMTSRLVLADVTRGDEILSQGKQVEVFGLLGCTVIHTYTAILGNRLNTSSFISQHPSQTIVVDGH